VYFEGARNNATFLAGEPLAPNGIVALFGEQLSANEPVQASSLPLTAELSGVRVLVNNKAAPIFYTSYNQVNFVIPPDTEPGEALIQVERGGQLGNTTTARIEQKAPRLLRLNLADYGIVVNQDGTFPIPVTPGYPSRPARVGDALVIYALGLGATSPAVAAGVPSPVDPLARTTVNYTVALGGGTIITPTTVTPFYVGLTPGLVGLYQINFTVPAEAPRGSNVSLALQSEDGIQSNIVRIAIE
jgi:uncharacterized protein (TIGR03437 family)